jgi:hypothetical protein
MRCLRSPRRHAGPPTGPEPGGRPCGPPPLRCSRRGRAAELATLTAFAALEQRRRACSRSALTRADPDAALLAALKGPVGGPARRRGTLQRRRLYRLELSDDHTRVEPEKHAVCPEWLRLRVIAVRGVTETLACRRNLQPSGERDPFHLHSRLKRPERQRAGIRASGAYRIPERVAPVCEIARG